MGKAQYFGLIIALSILSLITSGCGPDTTSSGISEGQSLEEIAADKGMSTSIVYHIQSAIHDINYATSNMNSDTLPLTIRTVGYINMTIKNAISFAKQDGNITVASQLQDLYTRLEIITSKENISATEFTSEVETIVKLLEGMIK